MGLIRGGLLAVVSVLLFLSLFAGNVFLTLTWSLEYETIKPELASVVKDILAQQGINLDEVMEEYSDEIESHCKNNSEYVFSEQGHVFVFSCDNMLQGPEEIIEQGIDSLIEEHYYKEYDCEFWDCLRQIDDGQPFVLISEKARDYWKAKFYLTLMISTLLLIIIFFLVQGKHKLFIIAGISLIIASLPFMKLSWVFSLISSEYLDFVASFFTKAYNVFLINFIIGLAVFGAGIGLKFWSVGFKLSEFFSKKNDVKKEVSRKEVENIIKKEVGKKVEIPKKEVKETVKEEVKKIK